MDDSLHLFFELFLKLWQLWGLNCFLILPLFLGVVAVSDFLSWLREKGGQR
jgi:hypothetical protein